MVIGALCEALCPLGTRYDLDAILVGRCGHKVELALNAYAVQNQGLELSSQDSRTRKRKRKV